MARALVLLLFVLVAITACDRVQADEGRDASLHVFGARFVREEMPAENGGPKVRTVTVGSVFAAGATNRSCTGEIDREGTAVAIGMAGDLGYWIVRADVPSASALDAPTFAADLSFAEAMRAGRRDLVVRAIDRDGRFGPPLVKAITIEERALPNGVLVVALSWDDGADLDLHVVDPRGVEIFKRNPSSYEPPPAGSPPEPPGTPHDGGVLDFDSNEGCVLDGRRAENVVWSDPPPPGHYTVRVDTFSLCREPAARWRVAVYLRGTRIAAAEGISTDADTRWPHDRGAGLRVLDFDVP